MYCIAGFGKVKNASEITAISNHNNRLHLTVREKARIDHSRTYLNQVLINPLNVSQKDSSDLNKKIDNFYKSNDIAVRKDSVLAIDLMLTTSPEFFGDWHIDSKITEAGQKKINEWVAVQMDFVKRQFGENATKYAVLHLDETTPHIHFLITPEEKKELKFKNKYSQGSKLVTTLNADRWNPTFWKKFLTNYEKFNKKFGLRKGEEGSMSENISIKKFNEMVSEASKSDYSKAIEKVIDNIKGDLSGFHTKDGIKKLLIEKLLPELNPMFKQNKALKKVLALDRAKEYSAIKKMKAELEAQLMEAISRKDLYIEAINEKYHDAKLLKELQEDNKKKGREIDRLVNKYENQKPTLANKNYNKGAGDGLHI